MAVMRAEQMCHVVGVGLSMSRIEAASQERMLSERTERCAERRAAHRPSRLHSSSQAAWTEQEAAAAESELGLSGRWPKLCSAPSNAER